MKINKLFLVSIMLFALALSPSSYATGIVPNLSGEGSASGETSGDKPNVSESGDTSGDTDSNISGDTSSDVLLSEALDSSYTITENESLSSSLQANIESGEKITYVITIEPSYGTLTLSDKNSPAYTYTPNKDFVGTDTFSFRLESNEKYSNSATVTIIVKEDSSNIIPFNYIDMQNHWANYSASHLAARGLITGEEIGNRFYYHPNYEMTRKDFMLFLLAITESNLDAEVEVSSSMFADKDAIPSWLLEAAKVAYSKGIIKGTEVGGKIYLNLDKKITRSEAIVMISNILGDKASTKSITYKDVASIPSWALNSVKNLSAYQIIQGDSNGSFRPLDILTRGEAAELSFKLLKQLEINNLEKGSGDIK